MKFRKIDTHDPDFGTPVFETYEFENEAGKTLRFEYQPSTHTELQGYIHSDIHDVVNFCETLTPEEGSKDVKEYPGDWAGGSWFTKAYVTLTKKFTKLVEETST